MIYHLPCRLFYFALPVTTTVVTGSLYTHCLRWLVYCRLPRSAARGLRAPHTRLRFCYCAFGYAFTTHLHTHCVTVCYVHRFWLFWTCYTVRFTTLPLPVRSFYPSSLDTLHTFVRLPVRLRLPVLPFCCHTDLRLVVHFGSFGSVVGFTVVAVTFTFYAVALLPHTGSVRLRCYLRLRLLRSRLVTATTFTCRLHTRLDYVTVLALPAFTHTHVATAVCGYVYFGLPFLLLPLCRTTLPAVRAPPRFTPRHTPHRYLRLVLFLVLAHRRLRFVLVRTAATARSRLQHGSNALLRFAVTLVAFYTVYAHRGYAFAGYTAFYGYRAFTLRLQFCRLRLLGSATHLPYRCYVLVDFRTVRGSGLRYCCHCWIHVHRSRFIFYNLPFGFTVTVAAWLFTHLVTVTAATTFLRFTFTTGPACDFVTTRYGADSGSGLRYATRTAYTLLRSGSSVPVC